MKCYTTLTVDEGRTGERSTDLDDSFLTDFTKTSDDLDPLNPALTPRPLLQNTVPPLGPVQNWPSELQYEERLGSEGSEEEPGSSDKKTPGGGFPFAEGDTTHQGNVASGEVPSEGEVDQGEPPLAGNDDTEMTPPLVAKLKEPVQTTEGQDDDNDTTLTSITSTSISTHQLSSNITESQQSEEEESTLSAAEQSLNSIHQLLGLPQPQHPSQVSSSQSVMEFFSKLSKPTDLSSVEQCHTSELSSVSEDIPTTTGGNETESEQLEHVSSSKVDGEGDGSETDDATPDSYDEWPEVTDTEDTIVKQGGEEDALVHSFSTPVSEVVLEGEGGQSPKPTPSSEPEMQGFSDGGDVDAVSSAGSSRELHQSTASHELPQTTLDKLPDSTAQHEPPQPTESHEPPQPTASHELPQPTAQHELPQPTAQHELPQPTAQYELPQPTASLELPQPTALHELPQPTAQHEPPQPTAQHELPQPTALHELPQPTALHELPQPTALHELPQPTALHELPQPTAQHELPQPTALHELPQPTALHEPPQPTALHELPQPTALHELPQPTASHELPQPTALHELPQPTASLELPQPTALHELPQPTALHNKLQTTVQHELLEKESLPQQISDKASSADTKPLSKEDKKSASSSPKILPVMKGVKLTIASKKDDTSQFSDHSSPPHLQEQPHPQEQPRPLEQPHPLEQPRLQMYPPLYTGSKRVQEDSEAVLTSPRDFEEGLFNPAQEETKHDEENSDLLVASQMDHDGSFILVRTPVSGACPCYFNKHYFYCVFCALLCLVH